MFNQHNQQTARPNGTFVVIFELEVEEGKSDEYLEIAQALKAELSHIEGFISIERFRSLTSPNKMLSLSSWESEAAIQNWRNKQSHRAGQQKGREEIFAQYRLRVAYVMRDYGMFEREQAPDDSRVAFDCEEA